jgi:transposase
VPLRLEPLRDAVMARVTAVSDAKLRDLRDWLQTTHNVRVSHAVMWKVLARLGLTHKKSISGPPSRTART